MDDVLIQLLLDLSRGSGRLEDEDGHAGGAVHVLNWVGGWVGENGALSYTDTAYLSNLPTPLSTYLCLDG